MSDQTVDLAIVVIANVANLLMVGIFVSRSWGRGDVGRRLGIPLEILALPVGGAVLLNVLGSREWWTIVLPCLLIAFLAAELVLDYILRLDFRHTKMLGPYLALYYLGLLGMIGYAFGVSRLFGFVTLATYLVNLAATGYSYSRVGHGRRLST
jgi:hypothetical protein